MIVIYIVVAVIGSLICALIKAEIDEWRDSPSMKRFRLSLNRNRCNETQSANKVVDITDDESFDSLSDSRESRQEERYSSITSRGVTANVSSNVAHVPTLEPRVTNSSQQHQIHDASDDTSIDKDVVVINEIPKTLNRSQSMFNWNETSVPTFEQNNFKCDAPRDSRFSHRRFERAPDKRRKLTNNAPSSNDDSVYLEEEKEEEEEEEALPPEVTIQYEKMIGGIKVKFPVDPYACQIGIVNSVILGCKRKQNCLLESPTGSGKTLALLCGVLAWQEQYSAEIHKENNEMDVGNPGCADDDCSAGDFFSNPSKRYCDDEEGSCDKMTIPAEQKSQKVPKVYYGTRTHKQIEQVIRELSKTAYRDKRMTVLSSREHSCIQNTKRNKTELCNELLDPQKSRRCPYYNDRNKRYMSSFTALRNYGLETPWDIEDLVSLGRNIEACPYFAARALMTDAEIIFCPYNYIVDPNIRESMQINLKDGVIILDEAHNIEDICREVASVDLRDDNLSIAAKECEKLASLGQKDHVYTTIRNYFTDVVKFLNIIDVKDNGNWGQMDSDYWNGSYFLQMLDVNQVGRTRFPDFLSASKAAISDFNMREELSVGVTMPTISRETKIILEHLCFAMQVLTLEASVDDYKAYVIETMEPKKHTPENTWISTKSCKVRTMKLICMNPAIIFAPLAREVRSVILASGTLTPMSSFLSELGVHFHYKPNLRHIITKEQMYVRCIPHGPTGKPLSAKFDKVNSFDFQDELGKLVLQVCNAVPYGVLCFFSSYTVMNKVLTRWKDINIWQELSALKRLFVEPSSSNELLLMMEEYREVIRESSSISFRQTSGAIFFAVFRGKVAEGIDFKDNEARCVLAVGIPYSNNKNAAVSMKMKYNDNNQSKGLLRGCEWYTVNAFRALNQALGRCIRHKDDWGAVLLVDERFKQRYNTNYLPNWIKSMWLENAAYNLRVELEDFVALQIAREKGKEYKERKKSM